MVRVRFGHRPEFAARLRRFVNVGKFECSFGALGGCDLAFFDAVVPLTEDDYRILSGHRPPPSAFVPPRPLVELFNDKLAFARHVSAGAHAHLVPDILAGPAPPFPHVLKRRFGIRGEDVHIVGDAAESRRLAPVARDPDYFRQAYVPGSEEYSLNLLVAHGRVWFASTARYVMRDDTPYVRSARHQPWKKHILDGNPHIAPLAALVIGLGFIGTCCVNYKVRDDVPMVIEINPRFGGPLIPTVNAYLDAYLAALRA